MCNTRLIVTVKTSIYITSIWDEHLPCSTEFTEDLLSMSSREEETLKKAPVSSSPDLVLFVNNTWSLIPLSDVFPSNICIVLFTVVTRKPRLYLNFNTQSDNWRLCVIDLYLNRTVIVCNIPTDSKWMLNQTAVYTSFTRCATYFNILGLYIKYLGLYVQNTHDK
jgi:hypothetical protein